MKELTKAEEQVMQILWHLNKGFVNDILNEFPDPKPAYNTVSTIVRILEKKGFVSYKVYGKTHEYFPLVTKDQYKKTFMGNFVKDYFSNSYKQMVSFFTDQSDISIKDLEEIKKIMEEQEKKEK